MATEIMVNNYIAPICMFDKDKICIFNPIALVPSNHQQIPRRPGSDEEQLVRINNSPSPISDRIE